MWTQDNSKLNYQFQSLHLGFRRLPLPTADITVNSLMLQLNANCTAQDKMCNRKQKNGTMPHLWNFVLVRPNGWSKPWMEGMCSTCGYKITLTETLDRGLTLSCWPTWHWARSTRGFSWGVGVCIHYQFLISGLPIQACRQPKTQISS